MDKDPQAMNLDVRSAFTLTNLMTIIRSATAKATSSISRHPNIVQPEDPFEQGPPEAIDRHSPQGVAKDIFRTFFGDDIVNNNLEFFETSRFENYNDCAQFLLDNNLGTVTPVEGTVLHEIQLHTVFADQGNVVEDGISIRAGYIKDIASTVSSVISPMLDVSVGLLNSIVDSFKENFGGLAKTTPDLNDRFNVSILSIPSVLDTDFFDEMFKSLSASRKYTRSGTDAIKEVFRHRSAGTFIETGFSEVDLPIKGLIDSVLEGPKLQSLIDSLMNVSDVDVEFRAANGTWSQSEVRSPYFYIPIINALVYRGVSLSTEEFVSPEAKDQARYACNYWLSVLKRRIVTYKTMIENDLVFFSPETSVAVTQGKVVDEIREGRDVKVTILNDSVRKIVETGKNATVSTIIGFLLSNDCNINLTVTGVINNVSRYETSYEVYNRESSRDVNRKNIDIAKEIITAKACGEIVRLRKEGVLDLNDSERITANIVAYVRAMDTRTPQSLLDRAIDIVFGVIYEQPKIADAVKMALTEDIVIDIWVVKDIIYSHIKSFLIDHVSITEGQRSHVVNHENNNL